MLDTLTVTQKSPVWRQKHLCPPLAQFHMIDNHLTLSVCLPLFLPSFFSIKLLSLNPLLFYNIYYPVYLYSSLFYFLFSLFFLSSLSFRGSKMTYFISPFYSCFSIISLSFHHSRVSFPM